jgi:drug/metabolite transporter (DMT)-like permease
MNAGTHSQQRPEQRPLRGIAMILAAVTTFAVMDTIAKHLSQTYPVNMVVWARYAFQMLVMIVVLAPRHGMSLVRSKRPGLQFIRGLLLSTSTTMFFLSLSRMPLAEASAISFATPLFLVMLSGPMLGEPANRRAWIAVAIGFAGIMIIMRPGSSVFAWIALLPLVVAANNSVYQTLTRKLAGVDPSLTTLFIPTLIGTALLSIGLPWFWMTPLGWGDCALMLTLGLLGGFGHFALIKAFEYAPTPVIAPFLFSQLVVAVALGWLVFDQLPDGWSFAGMAVVVASGIYIANHHRRRS